MKTKKLIFLFFGLIILMVPVYLIFNSENVLENGRLHKLRLQGYDPFDPFRGKYLRLNYDNGVPCSESLKEGDNVYVTFETDSMGFSYFANASSERPNHDNYMKSTVTSSGFDSWWGDGSDAWPEAGATVGIELDNLTKYFINEDMASAAEEVVQDYQRDRPNDIYVAIRVLDGEARLEDIYVEETPLLEFLKK